MNGRIISGARQLTQAELLARVARAASGLHDVGVGQDGAVAIILRNDFAFFEASMAASLIGAYAVPINWHFKADEAGYIVRDCGARAVLVHTDLLPQVADGIPDDVALFVVDTPPEVAAAYGIGEIPAPPPRAREWNAFVAEQEPWQKPAPGNRTSMIYTSGTTGRPKGVRREPAGDAATARMLEMVATVMGIAPDKEIRSVVTGPMYHSAPNFYALYAAQCGATIFLQPRFDAEQLLQLIEAERITHIHMVPTMFVRLLKLPEAVKAKYDASSLEFVVHAAAPCPPDVKRAMIDWWGPIINEDSGGTETGAVTFHTAEEALAKPGTVGRALPWGIARIYDDGGKQLGPDEIGEVFLRLKDWPDFTYHGQDERRREIERDGLVSCGDVGYLDKDGYLFLCDRAKDMVISGGVNIYPAEIEAVLIGMPGVHDCAVFGIPNEEYGEELCAYVEPENGVGLTADDVRGYLRENVAGYKVPRIVEFQSPLPREDSGKIFKRKLREPYWRDAGRRI